MGKPFKKHILLYIKGMAMGAVDLIPGVSGGTIAFITGIYEELLNSLRSMSPKNFKLFFSGKFKDFWKGVNGSFLLVLVLGIGTSIFSLAKYVVTPALDKHPIVLWSFFFGLVLISTFSILKTIRNFSMPMFICFGVGALIAYLVTVMSPARTPDALWFIFICGMVAVCALLLPGTSGAFMLLIMGKYQYILSALSELKVTILAVFIGGAVVGMLSFSHFLSWLLRKYHDVTIALLSGFLFGSLNKIWPWKEQIDTVTGDSWAWSMEKLKDNNLNLIEKNHLPNTFEQITSVDAKLFPAIASAILAIAIYVTFEIIAKRKTRIHAKIEGKSRK